MGVIDIEAIYPLSPTQEYLLLHTRDSTVTEAECEQLSCAFYGELDTSAFERAWQTVFARHSILRTSFVWKRIAKPHQVVRKGLAISLDQHDWRGLQLGEQQRCFEQYLQDDRRRGFDLTRPPLMRLALLRIEDTAYYFVWSYHHLLVDSPSLSVLLREVFHCYDAFCRGDDLVLPPSTPFQDHITNLNGRSESEAKTYWHDVFEGFRPATYLKALETRADAAEELTNVGTVQCPLSATLHGELQALAQQRDLTPDLFLMGAWALLLSNYGSDDEAVFGIGVLGRDSYLKETDTLVGPYKTILPLRVTTPPEMPLLSWLRELSDQRSRLNHYEHNSLQQIREWSGVSQSQHLFESVLNLEPHALAASAIEDLEIRNVCVSERSAAPLQVSLATATTLQVTFDRRRFGEPQIKRMLDHFLTLLKNMTEDLDARASALPLLSEYERHLLLREWNDTTAPLNCETGVAGLFTRQAEQTPDALALSFEDQFLTYQELNLRANQLAHHLQSLGIGPEVSVGVCMERSLEMVIGLLAILKAGGAFVPLDPSYPMERLSFMLEDAQAPVLLTQESILDELPSLWVHAVCPATEWETISRQPGHNPINRTTEHNLAYLIYTSGSTGQPKSVQITQRGLLNLVSWHQQCFRVTRADRATQLAGVAFDASVWEVWPYLLAGGSIHMPTEETRSSPQDLSEWLRAREITISFLPTPLAESVLALQPSRLSALRQMLTGGDKLHHHPSTGLPFELINNYGPTESSVVATSGLVPAQDTRAATPSIGRAVDNTQIYILDPYLRPVPLGLPGELHIGGSGLARGYLNRPSLTAEKFIPNPFSNERGTRLYKTGDLVAYRPSGEIEFLGRGDFQVEIRGHRVELGDVEAALRQCLDGHEVAVLAPEDAAGDRRLVAYIITDDPPALDLSEIRGALQERLPSYMIPSAFVPLESLPLTPNGKVDRSALPAPDKLELRESLVAPRTPTEKVLAKIWSDILGLEQIGIHENFFNAGGDSILGVQIIARANQAGMQLTTKQLFLYPTIAELASVVGESFIIQAEQGAVTGEVPLTPIQHWFFEADPPDPHHYNQAMLLEIDHALEPATLERAFQHLLVHHDALRLRFRSDTAGWQQFHAPPDEAISFTRVDLSHVRAAELPAAIKQEGIRLQTSLNLTDGPLLRVAQITLAPGQQNRLLIVAHHLSIDGLSWRILLEDLQTACAQLSEGQAIALPPKTTSFQYWSQRLSQYARSQEAQREAPYWLDEARVSVALLPRDYAEGANDMESARSLSVSFSREETEALLREVPEAYHTEINDVLLTALVQAFKRWTGERALLIDLEGHGREQLFEEVDLSRTVGWFTTIFPVCLALEEESEEPGEALTAVKEQLRRVPNRGIGYCILRYLSTVEEIEQRLRALPQAEVSFNYLGQFDQMLSKSGRFGLAKEPTGPTCSNLRNRSHLIEINGSIAHRQLHLTWTYSKNIHQRTTIEKLSQNFSEALQALIAHCQSAKAARYTPSDVAAFGWSPEDLDDVVAKIGSRL